MPLELAAARLVPPCDPVSFNAIPWMPLSASERLAASSSLVPAQGPTRTRCQALRLIVTGRMRATKADSASLALASSSTSGSGQEPACCSARACAVSSASGITISASGSTWWKSWFFLGFPSG